MTGEELAPAKVNLFLKVGAPGDDGYHPLLSWMVFADLGDVVRIAPAPEMAFTVSGPFASGVPVDGTNLVVRARDAFVAALEQAPPPFAIHLEKNLPPASGIGGGSSDAAAVLRLMQARWPLPEARLMRIAGELGADVPACLAARSLIAAGRGEVLLTAPATPPLPAVLVNPGAAVSTAAVFGAFDRDPSAGPPGSWNGPAACGVEAAIRLAAGFPNDLEAPAVEIEPSIAEVLAALRSDPRTRLGRMSGSGATCFALCETPGSATALASDLARAHPAWWVRACTLS